MMRPATKKPHRRRGRQQGVSVLLVKDFRHCDEQHITMKVMPFICVITILLTLLMTQMVASFSIGPIGVHPDKWALRSKTQQKRQQPHQWQLSGMEVTKTSTSTVPLPVVPTVSSRVRSNHPDGGVVNGIAKRQTTDGREYHYLSARSSPNSSWSRRKATLMRMNHFHNDGRASDLALVMPAATESQGGGKNKNGSCKKCRWRNRLTKHGRRRVIDWISKRARRGQRRCTYENEGDSRSNACSSLWGSSPKSKLSAMLPSLFSRRNGKAILAASLTLTILFTKRLALVASAAAAAAATTSSYGSAPESFSASLSTHSQLLSTISRRIKSSLAHVADSITHRPKQFVKRALFAVALVMTAVTILDVRATRKRQAIDATSEWGRYADHPDARARALMSLVMRLFPYVVAARFFTILSGGTAKTTENDTNQNTNDNDDDDNTNNNNNNNPDNNKKTNRASRKASNIRKSGGALFAEGLLRLGPLYIKIGQILSCREKVMPPEYIKALERLQDRVPYKSGNEAMQLAYKAFGDDERKFHSTFRDFDDVPLAAASLGQVHKAVLRSNNDTVAIKVQRPRLRDIYDKDLVLMHKIADAVDKFGGKAGKVGGVEQSWDEIFTDAEVILYREIDYRDEAENAIRFADDFGLGLGGKPVKPTARDYTGETLPSAASWLRTPYVYNNLTSEQFLVMEFVPSIKISNNEKLDEANVTMADREYLAESLARSYLRQFCCNRFFSTDPHPGNLGVEIRKGQRPRLVYYDFGQATSLSEDQAGGILDVIEATVDSDAKACVKAFDRMGVLVSDADLRVVEQKVQSNFDTGRIKVKRKKLKKRGYKFKDEAMAMGGGNPGTANSTSNSTLSNSTTATSSSGQSKSAPKDSDVMKFFTLPAEYAFVARALSQMDGVGRGLDPDFDFISASAPYIVEVKGATKYLKEEVQKFVLGFEKDVLKWQSNLLKKFGYDASKYVEHRKKKNEPSLTNENVTALLKMETT